MDEDEKQNLFMTFESVISSVIAEKKANPKYDKLFNTFEARINLGLQMEQDYFFWLTLIIEKGEVSLKMGKLEDNYDLILMSAPEDLMYFTNTLRGREKEKGTKTKMRVKLAAKLLMIAWTLMKKKEPFNPDHLNVE